MLFVDVETEKIGSFCITGRYKYRYIFPNLPRFLAKRRKIFRFYFIKCWKVCLWDSRRLIFILVDHPLILSTSLLCYPPCHAIFLCKPSVYDAVLFKLLSGNLSRHNHCILISTQTRLTGLLINSLAVVSRSQWLGLFACS